MAPTNAGAGSHMSEAGGLPVRGLGARRSLRNPFDVSLGGATSMFHAVACQLTACDLEFGPLAAPQLCAAPIGAARLFWRT